MNPCKVDGVWLDVTSSISRAEQERCKSRYPSLSGARGRQTPYKDLPGFVRLHCSEGARAIQFAAVTTREMEEAVANEPCRTARSSGAAEPKNCSGLNQLADTIAGPLREAEGSVASHPLSSIGAAFLLGLAIGRLTKRGSS